MYNNVRNRVSKNIDIHLLIYYVLLVIIGWLTIYSSEYVPNDTAPFMDHRYAKQLIYILVAIFSAIVVYMFDTRNYSYFAYFIYLFTLFVMILVIFVGDEISGAKAWIRIGSLSIQPTEFGKVGTALALAKFFNEGKTNAERKNMWLMAALFILIPVAITLLQKDTGSALVFFSFIILFYREGLATWILLFGATFLSVFVFTLKFNEVYSIAVLTAILLGFLIYQWKDKKKVVRNILVYACCIGCVFLVNFAYESVLQPHQRMRIDTLLDKVDDPRGADFNVNQSKIAIGSGGFFGKGYLNGTQTKLRYVPEQSTDFIFCNIGEEWGFVGSVFVCGLIIAMIIRILSLSEKQRNPFVRYYGYGIAGILFMHFFINIGMTIGLLPIIGIPLPFISYGGTSFLAFTIMLFIFLRMSDV